VVAPTYASDTPVERSEMLEFIGVRHHAIISTTRADESPQMSPVTIGVDASGAILVASYPERAKVKNLRRRPRASLCVLSDDFGGEWIQVGGAAEVIDLPEAVDVLVTYYRSISGEHRDWAEYREAMVTQGKVAIRVTPQVWGPISRGGFPPGLAGSQRP